MNQRQSAIGRHYVFSIMSIGMASMVVSIMAFLGMKDTNLAIIIIGMVNLFASQIIQNLMLFAKQNETNHRINGIVHELMESEGKLRFRAGEKQGRSDEAAEQHARDKECK
jgi:hypothetical protein